MGDHSRQVLLTQDVTPLLLGWRGGHWRQVLLPPQGSSIRCCTALSGLKGWSHKTGSTVYKESVCAHSVVYTNAIQSPCEWYVVGCFADGLYIEGAGWDLENSCLVRQKPKQLIEDLPVLKIIPIEAHKLKLQVGAIMQETSLNYSDAFRWQRFVSTQFLVSLNRLSVGCVTSPRRPSLAIKRACKCYPCKVLPPYRVGIIEANPA